MNSILATWITLNEAITEINSEKVLLGLLDEELASPTPRGMFLLRIHSRMNKLRAEREREELMAKVAKPPLSKDTVHQKKLRDTRQAGLKRAILAEERQR
jgi:hypothetical protein